MFDIPINMDIPSSSSPSSSSFLVGGRALDRHNPIVTDEKRSGFSSKPGTPIGTPHTHHILQHKPKAPITPFSPTTQLNSPTDLQKKNKKTTLFKTTKNTTRTTIPRHYDPEDDNEGGKMGLYEKSDVFVNTSKNEISKASSNVEYISPPESSRYLLDEDTSSLDVFSDFDLVLKLDDLNKNKGNDDSTQIVDSRLGDDSCKTPKPSSSLTESSDQVVVLRVSLHCRGCERKLKKHLSRMSGVTSFNIDFAAKKVTVMGDVTPLQVLANISKVKTAKLWSPPIPLSSSSIKY